MQSNQRLTCVALAAAIGGGCIGDNDPPSIVALTPEDGADVRGARAFALEVEYTDESSVDVAVLVDGEEVARPESTCEEESCTATGSVSTTGLAIGEHTLEVVLRDGSGNTTRAPQLFVVDDILTVKALAVTGASDNGALELEVYAFTEAGTLVGCAGSRHGLADANYADVPYTMDASLINMIGDKLGTADLDDLRIRLEIWEDDDDPVCPVVPDARGNTKLGESPALTAAEWRTQAMPIAFGSVTQLSVAWTRDLPEPAGRDQGPPPDDDDDLDFGHEGGGCATTGGSGGGLALALAALALVRRRFTA